MKELNERFLLNKEDINYLNQYKKVTEKVKRKIENHAKKYNIDCKICAWYKDRKDFYSDWCDGLHYTKEEARQLIKENKEEFLTIRNFGIVRFEM